MVWRTTLITLSTCFLLGTTFACWVADHNVLWRSPLTADAVENSLRYYTLVADAPGWLGWAYSIVMVVAVLSVGGRLSKGFREDRGEIVFDGANTVLLGAIIYIMTTKTYNTLSMIPRPLPATAELAKSPMYPDLVDRVVDLASDNITTAVMLTGVMLLQGGRYYAKRPSHQSTELVDSDSSQPSSPPATDDDATGFSPISQRAQTPYHELSEADAMGIQEATASQRKSRK